MQENKENQNNVTFNPLMYEHAMIQTHSVTTGQSRQSIHMQSFSIFHWSHTTFNKKTCNRCEEHISFQTQIHSWKLQTARHLI